MSSRKRSIQQILIAFARAATDKELDAAIDILRSFKDTPVRKKTEKKPKAEKAEQAKAATGATDVSQT